VTFLWKVVQEGELVVVFVVVVVVSGASLWSPVGGL
jgi:hypothetical protein